MAYDHDQLQKSGINIRVIDLYSLQPIDSTSLLRCTRDTKRIITVEDHYPAGGVGDAVASAVADGGFAVERLCVREIPRSGTPEQLVDHAEAASWCKGIPRGTDTVGRGECSRGVGVTPGVPVRPATRRLGRTDRLPGRRCSAVRGQWGGSA